MLLGVLADDEYWSDYGILVVLDGMGGEESATADAPDPALCLDRQLTAPAALESGATVAHAGAGWLWGRVGWLESYHFVRLEAHDAAPADDRGDWDEVLETPYWSETGTIALGTLVEGWDPEADELALGAPGLYRVRVSCVRDFSPSGADGFRPLQRTPPGFDRALSRDGGDEAQQEGDIWRLQFWPAPPGAGAPRWLARYQPVVTPTGQDLDDTCPGLATDLVAVARWTPDGAVATVADLADRLLASPAEVRAALETAVSAGGLRVEGDPAGDAALTLTPLAAAPDGPPAGSLASMALPLSAQPSFPDGPPPAAGIITSGRELVVWRAGVPEVLGLVERHADQAVATPFGVAVIGSKRAVLIRPDGAQAELAPDPDARVALSEDGRHLAIASSTFGRRPQFRLYLADLADGSAQVLDCPDVVSIASLRGTLVTYGVADEDEAGCFSWTPGQDPWPVPWPAGEIDRLTGTCLAQTESGDYVITRPDGTGLTVARQYDAQDSALAPGGRWLFDLWHEPPTLAVTDVSGRAPGPALTWPLPEAGQHPTWEDATHLLLAIPYSSDLRAIRVEVTTGAIERLRLGHGEDGTEFDVEGFVEPFRLA
jgi:hypothetical protein